MKRFLTILLSLIMLCACVPTPEEDVVVNKTETSLSESVSDEAVQKILQAVPTHWDASFSYRDGTASVSVDAAIDVPKTDRFPIVEVAPAAIDPQIAAQLLYQLIPGGAIRISDHGGQAYSLEDVDQWIEEVKQNLAHTNEMIFDSDAERDAYIDAQNAELERLFSMRESAVSGTVTLLKDYELLNRYGMMECRVLDADGRECANLLWKPQAADTNDKRESVLHIDSLLPSCTLLDHGVQSVEEAQQAADKLLKEIGLSDRYACVSVRDGINSVVCYYGIQYQGIRSSPLTETLIGGENGYRAQWANEMLAVVFQKREGRTSVSYVCPSKVIGEIGNAKLLPFAEVQTQFANSMKASYAWMEEDTVSVEITVTRISLGYYRVPQKDEPNRYALIPAWTFEGTRTAMVQSDDGSGVYPDTNDLPNNVIMILSGIDGSLLYAG